MQQTLNRAELAAALGVSEAKITALTIALPRPKTKPIPAYEPSSYILERSIEVSEIGDRYFVFNRTKIWADHRQIHSSARTTSICLSADDARQQADALRIAAKLEGGQRS